MVDEEQTYRKERRRINPRKPEDIVPHPRVKVVGKDHADFTVVEALLKISEGVCWRCGSIAEDPEGTLQKCPVCGGDFND